MQRTANEALKRFLAVLQVFAQKLAQRAVLVFMRTWLARLGWVTLAVSAIIWILEPDAMEKWSDKSVFRKDKSGQRKKFENEMEELAELEAAFAQMVGG